MRKALGPRVWSSNRLRCLRHVLSMPTDCLLRCKLSFQAGNGWKMVQDDQSMTGIISVKLWISRLVRLGQRTRSPGAIAGGDKWYDSVSQSVVTSHLKHFFFFMDLGVTKLPSPPMKTPCSLTTTTQISIFIKTFPFCIHSTSYFAADLSLIAHADTHFKFEFPNRILMCATVSKMSNWRAWPTGNTSLSPSPFVQSPVRKWQIDVEEKFHVIQRKRKSD